jgi:hypothetical protein
MAAPRFSRRRLAVAPAGVILGLVIWAVVPSHAAVVTPFDAIPIPRVVAAEGSGFYIGSYWMGTFCGLARAVPLPPKVKLECEDRHESPGFGRLRVDAPTLRLAEKATTELRDALQTHLEGSQFHASIKESGKPTWARTVPVWLGEGGLILALFCPLPRRTRPRDQSPPDRVLVAD